MADKFIFTADFWDPDEWRPVEDVSVEKPVTKPRSIGPLEHQLIGRYGPGIARFLQNRFSNMYRQCGRDPCVDNIRVADSSNDKEMADYESRRIRGCCGSADQKFYDKISGRTFWIGFNYGH